MSEDEFLSPLGDLTDKTGLSRTGLIGREKKNVVNRHSMGLLHYISGKPLQK